MWIGLSMMLAAVSLCLLCWWLGRPLARPAGNAPAARALPVRLLWPWVRALAPVCRPLMSWRLRRRIDELLHRAGMQALWSAHELCALQCVAGLTAGGLAALAVLRLFSPWGLLACVTVVAVLAAAWPVQHLRERIQRRRLAMAREFPFFLDMVTLCVEAGLNLHGALQQAAHNGPAGPLRDELHHMLSDVRTGMPRNEALSVWAQRCDLPAVHQFVAAMALADQSGMSLGPVLRAQADQRRNERFLRAEKMAMQAPVKMMFPLIFCIFPCSFLIIGFPIAAKFLALAG